MEWLIFVAAIAIGMVFIFIKGVLDEKNKNKKFISDLKLNYGHSTDREYEYTEFNSIKTYYERRQGEKFSIDDITWNDLSMDALFIELNHTMSSVGEEYLYAMLRTPVLTMEALHERSNLVEHFMNNEDERIKLQWLLHKIGRTKKVSVSQYLYRLKNVKRESNWNHYSKIILIFLAASFIFLSPSVGFMLLLGAIGFNITKYFKRKGEIDPYLTTFSYIVKMLIGTEELEKLAFPVTDAYVGRLKSVRNNLKAFRKNTYILMSGARMGGHFIEIPLDYLRMIFHLDLIKFNSMLKVLENRESDVEEMLEIFGILDSAIAIGAYRNSLQYYCKPELQQYQVGQNVLFKTEDLYHPLIDSPVPNSIEEGRGVLVTGSNASGKSTFLKSAAINAIFAQTIYTVPARQYKGNFFRIYSSMALTDNLENKESYYIVEIKSLKRILDACKTEIPVLCFVDEVLRGTNTVERIAASSRILQSLLQKHVLCFAATHDIELTHMLEGEYRNYHFEEEVIENDIVFNYRLYSGRAITRNAIKLLSIIGYDDEIIEKAEKTAERFAESGVWEL